MKDKRKDEPCKEVDTGTSVMCETHGCVIDRCLNKELIENIEKDSQPNDVEAVKPRKESFNPLWTLSERSRVMPTNLELLKSIHENGGEFEKTLWNTDPKRIVVDKMSKDGKYFFLRFSSYRYTIPSELEVEKKIVELLRLRRYVDFLLRICYIDHLNIWTYGVDDKIRMRGDSPFYEEHESRLTAGLMLWDKLLKEKR